MQIAPYLHFNGDCAAAFAFYAAVLRGRITMQMAFADSPMAAEMEPFAEGLMMHMRLEADGTVLMGSDTPPSMPAPPRGGFHVSVMTPDADEARRVFAALAEDGAVTMPIQATFWSPAFGMLVDRFGTPWMVNCEPAAP